MPRCYMVKKQSTKHQIVTRDCWNEPPTTGIPPDSPIEACIAPPYYTPLTNRISFSEDFNKDHIQNEIKEEKRSPSPQLCHLSSQEVIAGHDGGIPIFRMRSLEETEAAHDLLSLSQSLPPLPAPGAVSINETLPCDNTPPSTSPDCTYRPLSPEQNSRPSPSPLRVYQSPIVYVVQLPPAPTPPTSECSSDTENMQICITDESGNLTLPQHNEDILILPLSPEPEQRTHHLPNTQTEFTHNELPENIHIPKYANLSETNVSLTNIYNRARVIVSPSPKKSLPKKPTPTRQQSVIKATTKVPIPDNRTKRHNKLKKTNNNDADEKDNNTRIDNSLSPKRKAKFYTVEDEESDSTVNIPVGVEVDSPKKCRYVCSECGKQYATSSNLSRHKQTHRSLDSQSAKKCITCGKLYVSMPALAMHLLTHKLAHSCGICSKQFSRPWLLQGHLRSHTGEKPYDCGHCGKSFADRSNLRAHMQTHSIDKNFQCPKCKKTFALKSYLNKHLESACSSTVTVRKKNDYAEPGDPDDPAVKEF